MSKVKDLENARRVLSPTEFKSYTEWRNKLWVERYPYLAQFIIQVLLLTIWILGILYIKELRK